MKKIACLAAGICAALWSGVLHGAKLYLNPLVGSDNSVFVPSGTYGRTTTTGENDEETVTYAGLTLPANVIGKSFSSRTFLSASDPGASGSFTNIIKNGTYVDTHTVMGWFKINSLPPSNSYQMLWAAISYTNDHGGYRVCVTSAGEIAIGKINGGTYNFADGNTGEPLLTSGANIPANTWFHLAVVINNTRTNTSNGYVSNATPTVYINGKLVNQATAGTFATNLNGNSCTSLVTGMGISAAGFYVDDAVMSADAIRTQAVSPMSNVYPAAWTRTVTGNTSWNPAVATNFLWNTTLADVTSFQPVVLRGTVALTVAPAKNEDGTIDTPNPTVTINASPILESFSMAYGADSTGTVTLSASAGKTLTSAATTLAVDTTLAEAGGTLSLGNVTIGAGRTFTVGTRRTFTLAAIGEGAKLRLTPTTDEKSAGQITLAKADSLTLTAAMFEVTGYASVTVEGSTITLPTPIWRPTAESYDWANNWLNSESAPTGGEVVLDLSALTAGQSVTIPSGTAFDSTLINGAAADTPSVVFTAAEGVTLGATEVRGNVTLPITTLSAGCTVNAVYTLTLSGTGTLSGTATPSQNITGTGAVALAANANLTLGSAGVLANTLTITGDATSAISTGAFIPSCNLTNAGWQGTFKFTTNLGSSSSAEQNMNWSTLGSAHSKVVIPSGVTITGYFNSGNSTPTWTLAAAVELNGIIDINNGVTTNSYVFSGALSGSGTFKLSGNNGATIAVLLRNVNAFTGTLTIANESSMNKAFIVGGTRNFASTGTTTDKGKIVIAGEVRTDAVRKWTAKNGISVEGTLTTALSEPETTSGCTLTGSSADGSVTSAVTVATGGQIIFVRTDGWRSRSTSATFDPASGYIATWTGSGSDNAWSTIGNWQSNGTAVTTAPGTALASLTVAAGKTITLPGAVTVDSLTTQGNFTLGGTTESSLTVKAIGSLGGEVTVNAPLVLDLSTAFSTDKKFTVAETSSLTTKGTITFTHVDCAFRGALKVERGKTTWKHNTDSRGGDRTISGDITVETNATFAVSADYKWTTTLSGSLAGAGKLRAKAAQKDNQNDGTRLVEITAGCEAFTGTVELELSTTGGDSSTPRRSNLLLAPKDGKFNGNIAVQKINFSGNDPADTTENVSDAAWAYARVFFTGSCTFGGLVKDGLSVYVGQTTTNGDDITDVSSAVEVAFSQRNQPYTGKTTIAAPATLKLSGNDALLGADSEASKVVVNGKLTCENPTTGDAWTAVYRTVEGSGTIEVPAGQTLVIGTRYQDNVADADRVDSGLNGFTGTLKVLGTFDARSWWSSTDIYDIGGFDVTLGDNGKITRHSDAKPARLTIAANKTLSGNGTIEIPVIWNAAATLDATGATLDACTTFANTLTLAENGTMTVKVDEPSKLFSILPSNLTLKTEQIAVTSDNTVPEGGRVAFFDKTVTNNDGSTTQWATALLFVPPSVPASSDPETPRESGVDEAITQAAGKMQIAEGKVISEVTSITAQSATPNSGERQIDAAALFENVVTLTTGEQKENGTYPATATVAYDFGVSDITVVNLAAAVENGALSAGTQYVVVCAKVSNATGESANTADYATGIALKLLKNEGSEVPDVVEGVVEPTAGELAALRLSAAKGERWLAVPMTTLFPVNRETSAVTTGTMKLTVQATNGAATP